MTNQFSITKTIIEANLKQLHNITPTEKLVLVCLSSYLGQPDNSTMFICFPSQSRIAREVGCVRSTVNSALQKFEELGFLRSRWQVKACGANSSKLYTWLGIPPTEEQDESESSSEPSEAEVVETTMETNAVEVEVVERISSFTSEASNTTTSSSSYNWADNLDELFAEDNPF